MYIRLFEPSIGEMVIMNAFHEESWSGADSVEADINLLVD